MAEMPPFNNQMFQGMPPQGVSQMGPGGGMSFGGFDPRMLQQYLTSMQGQQAPFEQQGPGGGGGGMESMPQGAPMPPPGWEDIQSARPTIQTGPMGNYDPRGVLAKPFQVQPGMGGIREMGGPTGSFGPPGIQTKPWQQGQGGNVTGGYGPPSHPNARPMPKPGFTPGGGMQGAPQGAPMPPQTPAPRMPPTPRLPPNAGVYKNPVAGMQNQTPIYSGQVRPPGPQRNEVTGGLMAPDSPATATRPPQTTRPKEGGSPPFNPDGSNGTISAMPPAPEPITMGPSGSFSGNRDKMKAELRTKRVSEKR